MWLFKGFRQPRYHRIDLPMKERPILFSGPMVRAILDGRKTQTRWIVKPLPGPSTDHAYHCPDGRWNFCLHTGVGGDPRHCPYGVPGDTLWATQGSAATRSTGFENRFWERTVKFEDCWEWFGRTNKKRYGLIRKGKKAYATHRVSWEMHNGPIPDKMHVLHHCDMPWCVNPAHLWLGTNADNVADKMAKGRHRSPSGEDQKDSWLSWEEVHEIRALYWEQYLYQKDIAAQFGIHQSQVSKIVNGKQWQARPQNEAILGHRTLEVTDVRIERVQEISEGDCEAEGLDRETDGHELDDVSAHLILRPAFAALWRELNAKRGFGWEANPWVWALTFKRIEATSGNERAKND